MRLRKRLESLACWASVIEATLIVLASIFVTAALLGLLP